jgi:carboxypeptidase PM20D1
MPARIPPTTLELLRRLAPELPRPVRPLLERVDRLQPVLARALTIAGPEAAAMARTTFAVTTLEGSGALNVIATSATAGLSIRVMPGDTVHGAIDHLRKVVKDPGITVTVIEHGEASPVSPTDDAFDLLTGMIGEVFPDAIPVPYVMTGATDSRYFTRICERVYRFAPFRMTRAQRQAVHSYDEHLDVDAFLTGIRWYCRLLESLPA